MCNFAEVWSDTPNKLLEVEFEGTGELSLEREFPESTETMLFNSFSATLTDFKGTVTAEASSCRTCFKIEDDERLTVKVGIN